jgi:two-component system, NtrC family, sensor histidine kinase HydH
MRPHRIVRWGWLATTFALAAALLATAWMGRRRAADAQATLNRGQGEVLLEAAREVVRITPQTGLVTALDSLVARHQSVGLRFVALLGPEGDLLAQVGTPLGGPVPIGIERPGPPALAPAGPRLRLVGFAPPVRTADQQEDLAQRPRGRPSLVVLEFEPLVAERLSAQATDTFALSAAVAVTLLAAALIFWRLTLRGELAERRLEEQRRLGVLGEMSAVLAHEIRNPLASLKGHAQLLAERMPDASSDRRKAERVVREAQRLEALTSDLLDFARSGPIDIRPGDPVALLRSCIEEVGADDFTVHVQAAPRAWPMDVGRMRQALTNILRNAQQASPAGTRPVVTLEKRDGSLVVAVRDFGTGIPAGDEKRIFSPFYTTRTTGTGLGLAVALRVAEMHGGTIVAENEPAGGAVFRMTIPGG